jgi:hypothetical protein
MQPPTYMATCYSLPYVPEPRRLRLRRGTLSTPTKNTRTEVRYGTVPEQQLTMDDERRRAGSTTSIAHEVSLACGCVLFTYSIPRPPCLDPAGESRYMYHDGKASHGTRQIIPTKRSMVGV